MHDAIITSKDRALEFLQCPNPSRKTAEFRSVDFSGTHFQAPVDFSKCLFRGRTDFSSCVFDCDTKFHEAVFNDFVSFNRAVFGSSASFRQCQFLDGGAFAFAAFQEVSFYRSFFRVLAVFWSARFDGEADFSQCVVDVPHDLPAHADTQTNFSWAVFNERAVFTLSRFLTPVYLWRAIFADDVLLDQCVFDKEIVVGARPTDVHFTQPDALSSSALRELMRRKVLVRDMEGQFGDVYQFNLVCSTEDLEVQIASLDSLTDADRAVLLKAWTDGNRTMFREGSVVSFSGTQFHSLDKSVFNHVDLSGVNADLSISGSPEDKSRFTAVLKAHTHDFFISYAREQNEFAQQLARALTKCGQVVWLDEKDIDVGDTLQESIKTGLENSMFFIMLLSREYFIKRWTNNEFRLMSSSMDKIIQIWHGVSEDEVRSFNEELADRVAFPSGRYTNAIEKLALDVIKYVARKRA